MTLFEEDIDEGGRLQHVRGVVPDRAEPRRLRVRRVQPVHDGRRVPHRAPLVDEHRDGPERHQLARLPVRGRVRAGIAQLGGQSLLSEREARSREKGEDGKW